MVGNFYGQTGGHENEDAAKKTDDILEVLVAEMGGHGSIPKCVVGDLNAEPEDIPMARYLIEGEGWVDCGAVAEVWGASVLNPSVR